MAPFFYRFMAPMVLGLGCFAAIGRLVGSFRQEDWQMEAALTAYGIILAGVLPVVLVALILSGSPRKRAVVLLGGSLAKLVIIGLLVFLARRNLLPFSEKTSFLIWLFLSYLVISSLGWFVVAAQGNPGKESGRSKVR